MRLEIHGGPFDGGVVAVPRRTRPGLLLDLSHAGISAEYRIERHGRSSVVTLVSRSRELLAV